MSAKLNQAQFTGVFGCAAVVGAVLVLIKVLHSRRRMGFAERAGKGIDGSIKSASHYLERASEILGATAEEGMGRIVGKGVDDALTEAKASLNKVSILVQNAVRK